MSARDTTPVSAQMQIVSAQIALCECLEYPYVGAHRILYESPECPHTVPIVSSQSADFEYSESGL